MRDHVANYFKHNPVTNNVSCRFRCDTVAQLGIGSTYNSHPVGLASAYAALKVFFRDDVLGNVQRMEPVMKVSDQAMLTLQCTTWRAGVHASHHGQASQC